MMTKVHAQLAVAASPKQRRPYARELERAFQNLGKDFGWRGVQGILFKEINQWFVTCHLETSLLSQQTSLIVSTKPMAIDPIFWGICGFPENKDKPLSFRALGAWTCPALEMVSADVAEATDASDTATTALNMAGELLGAGNPPSLAWFEAECRKAWEHQPAILASIITTLVATERRREAVELCLEAKARGETGGFVNAGDSFVQAAIRRLQTSLSA